MLDEISDRFERWVLSVQTHRWWRKRQCKRLFRRHIRKKNGKSEQKRKPKIEWKRSILKRRISWLSCQYSFHIVHSVGSINQIQSMRANSGPNSEGRRGCAAYDKNRTPKNNGKRNANTFRVSGFQRSLLLFSPCQNRRPYIGFDLVLENHHTSTGNRPGEGKTLTCLPRL